MHSKDRRQGWIPLVAAVSFAVLSAGIAPAFADVPLIEAVKAGDTARLRDLLGHQVDVNASEADGTTALHWAVRQDQVDAADLLIDAGADVAAENRYGVAPLLLACTNGSAIMIARLLDAGANPNTASPQGETALMTAARTGAVEAVTTLLTHGADVDAREGWRGHTALMWAAAEGHLATLEALIAAGAEVEARSIAGGAPTGRSFFEADEPAEAKTDARPTGLSALLFAVREGHTDAVRLLLAAGADVGGTAPDGTTPLAIAILNDHYALAKLLLDEGAEPNAADPRGSLLHALAWKRRPGNPGAAVGRPPEQTSDRDSLALAEALLSRGANANARITWDEGRFDVDIGSVRSPRNIGIGRNYLSFIGATPFYLAAKHGDIDYMRLLVEHGANPLTPTEQNITPLMAAAGLGFWDGESPGPLNGTPDSERLEAVKYALELGNDIDATADFGEVHMEGDGVTLLLRHPLNLGELGPNARGDMRWTGSTALHGAAVMGSTLIVEYLVQQGAELNATNLLGWTPLMVAEGVFVANTEKSWPDTVTLLRELGAR